MNVIQVNRVSGNAVPAVRQALSRVRAGEENLIRFEKGSYHFFKDGTFEGDFYPSNNTSGRKNVVFPILGLKNLTLDGAGSEFVFCDRVFPFVVQNCEAVTLKNFDIDFSFPRHCEATVQSADGRGFELKIDRKRFDFEVENGHLIFHIGSYIASSADRRFFLDDLSGGAPPAYLFAGDTADSTENLPALVLLTDAEETESGVFFKYRAGSAVMHYRPGDILFIGNDERRENDVIFAEFSKEVRFERIRMFRGAGMGIIAQICTDVSVEGLEIFPKSGRDTLLSITADALHFVNCDGKITVRNCTIAKTIDDALNIHGVYSLVDEVLSENRVRLRFGQISQNGLIPFQAGDTAVVNDMESGIEKGSAAVRAVSFAENRTDIILTFEADISKLICVGDALENPGRMAELEFVNNRISDLPHLRVSTCKHAVISGNIIRNATIVVDDLYDYWYESGAVEDLEISGNTFCETGGRPAIVVRSCRKGEHSKKHRKVTVVGNRFNQPQSEAVEISAVEESVLTGNRFSDESDNRTAQG